MTTTLDLPDEVAAEVQRRAQRHGRELADQLLQLVKVALAVDRFCDEQTLSRLLRIVEQDGQRVSVPPTPDAGSSPVISTDPATGLPLIHGPPDAHIHSMSAEQIQALIEETQLEEDLERAGLPVRH